MNTAPTPQQARASLAAEVQAEALGRPSAEANRISELERRVRELESMMRRITNQRRADSETTARLLPLKKQEAA